jgi:hypothetical protein
MINKSFRKALIWAFCGLTLFILSAPVSFAEEEEVPVLETEARTVAIFKNGLGFFQREGETALKQGWAVLKTLPNAALGTLWIGSLDREARVEEVISLLTEVEKEKKASSLLELLDHNVGKKVTLTALNKEIEGTLQSAPGNIVVIANSKDTHIVVNKNSITKIEFPEPYTEEFSFEAKEKRMKFKIATKKNKAKLALSYLQKGISWIPSYLVNISDPDKARITMKATIINDVEDLKDVDAFFVVGYPNFVYADILSPMALDQALQQFISALESPGRRQNEYSRMANIMRQSVVAGEREEAVPIDLGYAAIRGLPGASEEDLFLYNKRGISLKKGERAYYHIFSDEVDYKHIYEWNVPDTINVDPRGYQSSSQQEKTEDQVWHSIKLTNSTDYPWTTAPALTVSGWKPLAQDTINYTPRGTKMNLKLTVATDIKTNKSEDEAERQRDIRLYRHSYDLVTVKGELFIKNAKTKDVTMEIRKRITGEVMEVSHEGKVKKVAEGLRGVNFRSSISWELPIKAGEEIILSYTYKVYIVH